MNFQKIATGAVIGTVFLFLVDWVWYGMLMKDQMNDSVGRPQPDFMWLIIGYLVFTFAFVTIYLNWSGGSSKVNAGMNFGMWVGLMTGIGMNLINFSVTTILSLSQTFTEGAYMIVKFVVLGIIVAFVTNKPATTRA